MARVDRGDVRLRLASAAVLAPLALAAAWLGGPYLAVLVLAAAAGMGWEWARLTSSAALPITALTVLATSAPILVAVVGSPRAALGLAAVGAAAVWIAARGAGARAPGWAALGTVAIVLPCLACLRLAADPAAGRGTILWLFATVWASDTGAFLAGRRFGGPRLAPRLSPNKTWAGSVGGVAAAAAVGGAAAILSDGTAAILVPAGIVLGLAAQLGDLAESLAKRRFGVKDSSGLIPGHGGLLDRLDGLLAAAAVQFLMTLWAGSSPIAWRV
ncbi:MAG TPA: phosphatidate cytidylyltransferase [Stellaceae bacterium]|nr:phosphatidate cytidylyltransferase [Stellaceae bacterium]